MHLISCVKSVAETTLPCNEELGMASYAIQDFQISATSTHSTYIPANARPSGTGWQALKSDVLPFIQVLRFS
jgi:hypothetical protein